MTDPSITRRAAAQLLGVAAATPALAAKGSDICFLTATEMADLIRRKKLSARETLDAHLKQIERVNPQVNAIVTLVAEQAVAHARKADEAQSRGAALGPLHGLPIAHKDLVETAGIRTTFGSRIFKDNVPKHDAILVERIRNAGAICLGKSNTPEFGAGSQTFNAVFGATKNPRDLTKTCGGSSGGAAVRLACGMLPIADGSDSGGSLRNPAAFCGVVGFRVAPGRVAQAASGDAWNTISVSGPMARTVPDPRVLTVVNAQRKAFENLGCIVEPAEPNWTGALAAYDTLRAWDYAATQSENVRLHRDLVKDTIQWEVERGSRLSGADIDAALSHRNRGS